MNTLEKLRKQIDQADAKLINILSDRMKLVKRSEYIKIKGIPPLDKNDGSKFLLRN